MRPVDVAHVEHRRGVEVAGIERVLVNGQTIVEQGRLSGARPGHVLRMG